MQTININGQNFTIEELNAIIENSKKSNPMDEVFKYHNTTELEFNNQYEDIPAHLKAYQKEVLIVSFYNKGILPDWTDGKAKYFPYFNMGSSSGVGFSCYDYAYWHSISNVGSRLCFVGPDAKKNMLDAVEKFLPEYKESRTL